MFADGVLSPILLGGCKRYPVTKAQQRIAEQALNDAAIGTVPPSNDLQLIAEEEVDEDGVRAVAVGICHMQMGGTVQTIAASAMSAVIISGLRIACEMVAR